jgi:hypothetical protein
MKSENIGENRPKINIIAISRIDEHAGNFLHR